MEANMLKKIAGGEEVDFGSEAKDLGGRRDSDDGFLNGRPRRSSIGGIRLVRTISTIDGKQRWTCLLCYSLWLYSSSHPACSSIAVFAVFVVICFAFSLSFLAR
jgi:hypothetical protein